MGRSPAASRRRLGAELRGLRESAGMKIEDAARVLRCSTAKVSRLETGKGVPFERDVRDLIDAYGPEARDRSDYLYELVAEGRAQDWLNDFRDIFHDELYPDHLLRLIEFERDAAVIKTFEADLVPGLLQTVEYTDAVYSSVAPNLSADDRARLVQFRRERQVTLLDRNQPPELSFILSEAVVLRPMGGPDVLRRQLEKLVTDLDGALSQVDFRVTPQRVEAPGALGGPFVLMQYSDPRDQDVVYLEGREGARYFEDDTAVERYDALFEGLERYSLSRDESIKLLTQEIDHLTEHRG